MPGSHPLTLRSWPFGAPSRRRLVELILTTTPPEKGWSKRGLEKACLVGAGALDEHLANLVGLELLELRDGHFFHPSAMPALASALREVVRHTAPAPDTPATPLPRRRYTRRP